MERNEAAHIIEAILFVAGEPVGIGDVAAALGLTELETVQTVEEMQRQYDLERRGVTLRRYGDHLRMETRQEYAPYVERLLQPVQRQSLTHRKGTMERCDTLFGVAMEERGISSMVSVNLKDYQ